MAPSPGGLPSSGVRSVLLGRAPDPGGLIRFDHMYGAPVGLGVKFIGGDR